SKCAMGPSFERMKDEQAQLITEPPFIHPSSFIVHPSLLRLGQRPLAGLVPNFIARQPAPGGLDGEDASEAGRVPAAGHPRTSLARCREGPYTVLSICGFRFPIRGRTDRQSVPRNGQPQFPERIRSGPVACPRCPGLDIENRKPEINVLSNGTGPSGSL